MGCDRGDDLVWTDATSSEETGGESSKTIQYQTPGWCPYHSMVQHSEYELNRSKSVLGCWSVSSLSICSDAHVGCHLHLKTFVCVFVILLLS